MVVEPMVGVPHLSLQSSRFGVKLPGLERICPTDLDTWRMVSIPSEIVVKSLASLHSRKAVHENTIFNRIPAANCCVSMQILLL